MIGKHKDRITISSLVKTPDTYGGYVETFTNKWTGFAGVERISGGRGIEAGGLQLNNVFEFTLRKESVDVVKTDRISYDGRELTIASIDDTDDRWYKIVAA